jgi:hypothetical protein
MKRNKRTAIITMGENPIGNDLNTVYIFCENVYDKELLHKAIMIAQRMRAQEIIIRYEDVE